MAWQTQCDLRSLSISGSTFEPGETDLGSPGSANRRQAPLTIVLLL